MSPHRRTSARLPGRSWWYPHESRSRQALRCRNGAEGIEDVAVAQQFGADLGGQILAGEQLDGKRDHALQSIEHGGRGLYESLMRLLAGFWHWAAGDDLGHGSGR